MKSITNSSNEPLRFQLFEIKILTIPLKPLSDSKGLNYGRLLLFRITSFIDLPLVCSNGLASILSFTCIDYFGTLCHGRAVLFKITK